MVLDNIPSTNIILCSYRDPCRVVASCSNHVFPVQCPVPYSHSLRLPISPPICSVQRQMWLKASLHCSLVMSRASCRPAVDVEKLQAEDQGYPSHEGLFREALEVARLKVSKNLSSNPSEKRVQWRQGFGRTQVTVAPKTHLTGPRELW